MTTTARAVRETARSLLADDRLHDLRGELDRLGFVELVAEEPRETIRLFFEEQGRAGRVTGALDLLIPVADRTGTLPVFHPLDAGRGLVLAPPSRPALVAVPVATAGRVELVPVPIGDGRLAAAGGFASGLEVAVLDLGDLPGAGRLGWQIDSTDPVLARLRYALACELLGAAGRITELTVEHVRLREQFGRPLGTRQAVRHRLADVHVAVSAARAVTELAPVDDPLLAAAGKALAGRAALSACDWALQFHGAIGFTREHRLPHHVRQVRLLDGLLGSTAVLSRMLGARFDADAAAVAAALDVLGPTARVEP